MSHKYIPALLAIALIAIAVTYFFLTSNGPDEPVTAEPAVTPTETVTKRPPFPEPRIPPAGFKEYRSVFYRFQLLYPESLAVTEEKLSGSATLLTFESSSDRSFQIFIIPHGDPHITEYRLEQDLPSGVMESPKETTVDGVAATAFVSSDDGGDDLREIWFVNKGFLYEVSAPIEFDDWLSEILTGWMFL